MGPSTSLALDSRGDPHITYWISGMRLVYTYRNTTGWHRQILPARASLFTSLALGANNSPFIVSTFTRRFDLTHVFSGVEYLYHNGFGWQVETVQRGPVATPIGNPSLVLDGKGRPHLSYFFNSLKYARGTMGVWQIFEVEAPNPYTEEMKPAGRFNSLKLNISNLPVISFYDEATGDLKLAVGVRWIPELPHQLSGW